MSRQSRMQVPRRNTSVYSRPPMIVISGYYGAGNAGDEAILAAMLAALRRTLPDAFFTVLSKNPEATRAAHSAAALDRALYRDFWAKARILHRADLFLCGGGGLWQDVYPRRRWPKTVVFYFLYCLAARFFGCRVVFYGLGVGPLRGRLARFLVRSAARTAELITVRDRESAAVLYSLGLDRRLVHVTADPACILGPAAEVDASTSFISANTGPLLAVSVRPWFGLEHLRTIAAVLDRAVRDWGLSPIFLSLGGEEDRPAAAAVIECMECRETAKIMPVPTVNEIREIISRTELALGMRLHSLIFAALAGVPAVGLCYDPKVRSFLGMLGLPEMAVPLEADVRTMLEKMADCRERRGEIMSRMRAGMVELRGEAWRNVEMVRELLARKG